MSKFTSFNINGINASIYSQASDVGLNNINGINSNNIQDAIKELNDDIDVIIRNNTVSDLDISDENGCVLARFNNGHFSIKNFNSDAIASKINTNERTLYTIIEDVSVIKQDIKSFNNDVDVKYDDSTASLNIGDENGNVIIAFKDGHIKTKKFNSEDVSTIKENKFENKLFSFIGDSITTYNGYDGVTNTYYPKSDINSADKTWWGYILSNTSASLCHVSATGGSTVTDGYGTAPSFQLRYMNLFTSNTTGTPPDFIFILAGINDWNASVSLGSFDEEWNTSDSSLPTTFIPSYRRFLYNLQKTYPDSQIISITPLRSFRNTSANYPPIRSDGKVLNDYIDAIKTCCEYHGVVCFDAFNAFNINEFNASTYLIDMLHPKAALSEKLATFVVNNLNIYF